MKLERELEMKREIKLEVKEAGYMEEERFLLILNRVYLVLVLGIILVMLVVQGVRYIRGGGEVELESGRRGSENLGSREIVNKIWYYRDYRQAPSPLE